MKRELTRICLDSKAGITVLDEWAEVRQAFKGGKKPVPFPTRLGNSTSSQRDRFSITHLGLHYGEEKLITGEAPAATVYFSKCPLTCPDCTQDPSWAVRNLIAEELRLELREAIAAGAETINLVSPTVYGTHLEELLVGLKTDHPDIPLVYNCSGYESPKALRVLAPYIDIFLPDIKAVSQKGMGLRKLPLDYAKRVLECLTVMLEGRSLAYREGRLVRGILVRHLLIPGLENEVTNVLMALKPFATKIHVNLMTTYYQAAENRVTELPLDESALLAFSEFSLLKNGVPL